MKGELELPLTVQVENAEKVFVKKVKSLGGSAYVSVPRKFIDREVLVIVVNKGKAKVRKIAKL